MRQVPVRPLVMAMGRPQYSEWSRCSMEAKTIRRDQSWALSGTGRLILVESEQESRKKLHLACFRFLAQVRIGYAQTDRCITYCVI